MKKLIFVIIAIHCSLSGYSQQIVFNNAVSVQIHLKAQSTIPYYTQPNLHKFEGTYLYNDGNQLFKIKLWVQKTYIKGTNPFYLDNIVGYHTYIKSNATVQDSFGGDKTITSGGSLNHTQSNKISFLFTDLKNKRVFRGTLELLPNNEIAWKIRNLEGIRATISGQNPKDYSSYVPADLILKKID